MASLEDDLLMLAAGGVESGEEDNISEPKEPGTPRSRSQSPAASRFSSRSLRSRSRSRHHSPPLDRKSPSTDGKMPARSAPRRARRDSEESGEA